ncbi:MAG: STAS domain-containing protein [Chromatiales bacterium]|nr:STAS domain-containing protein [Chromatiales bacterium]
MSGKVYHAAKDGVHVLRFQGELRCPVAPAVEDFLDALFQDGRPLGIVVDLTESDYIDSTHLGLLASLSMRMRPTAVTLVSNRPEINRALKLVNFQRLFTLVPKMVDLPSSDTELPVTEGRPEDVRDTVISAHKTLMSLSSENHEAFRELVDMLTDQDNCRH